MTIPTREMDYDTLSPEMQISQFLIFCKDAKNRIMGNAYALQENDDKTQDLMHFAELHDNLNCRDGNELYKKIREVRRERRLLKNETELLAPIEGWIDRNQTALKDLEKILGATRTRAEVIAKRMYMTKTDVLDEKPPTDLPKNTQGGS